MDCKQKTACSVTTKIRTKSGLVPSKKLNSQQIIKDMAEIADLRRVLEDDATISDFKKKYNRKYTNQESHERPLTVIYEDMGVVFLIKKGRSKTYYFLPSR